MGNRKQTKFRNAVPEVIGDAFLRELRGLVTHLASEGGFKEKYLESEFMSKFCDTNTVSPEQRRAAAIEKWLTAEENNRKSNLRLYLDDEDFGYATSSEILSLAAKYIRRVLGPIDKADLLRSSHTNGASTRVRRSEIAAILKHSGKAHGTSAACMQWSLGVYDTILEDQDVQVVEGSSLFTVPKKTEIDRVACKEPEINLFLQRGVGRHIRTRLRKVAGINLNDQGRNQVLAKEGVSRGLATIDLKSASDSICRQLVLKLLPIEWFWYLDDIRSHTVSIPGQAHSHELEMFSSMGNGFTFELESMIFWALAHAIKEASRVSGIVSVYGDDIIVPTRIARRLIRTFHWFGFKSNPEKSFWTGPFRESCGLHVHSGRDVTPFYVREPVREVTEVIRILNRLLYWEAREWGFITDPSVAKFHYKWSLQVPRRLWGGQDIDAITALVTGHRPRMRLIPKPRNNRNFLDIHRLHRWYTVAEESSVGDTAVHPVKISSYRVSKPSERDLDMRTPWDPWFIHDSHECTHT